MYLHEHIPILKTSTDLELVQKELAEGKSTVLGPNVWLPVKELHLSLDWDLTVTDNEADDFVNNFGREAFTRYEIENVDVPHRPGVMYKVLEYVQNIDNIKVSIVTARSEIESKRVAATLKFWNFKVDGIYAIGESSKGEVVKRIGAHVHIDDLMKNVHDVNNHGVYGLWLPSNVTID